MSTPTSLPRFADHLEELLLRFDETWKQPSIEDLRRTVPADAPPAFILELVRIDIHKHVALGLPVLESRYLHAFPEWAQQPWLLNHLREMTLLPAPIGESVLRALAATTPTLQLSKLADVPSSVRSFHSDTSSLPKHRYRLDGEIARGGMGAVLRGRDEDLGREIAVKVMLQNHAGKTELLQRFVEEAQIAGQLQHPGITPVYELGQFPDQRPYFTMKLVRGETLAAILKARKDPSEERPRFLKIFDQVCQTMAYAHTRHVIHRDLKPHNIMVGSFGEVQVMDWGLAKVMESESPPHPSSTTEVTPIQSEGSVQTKRSIGLSTDIPHTQAGSILGTPAYMSPEQARGDVELLDERADVFGLGAILCEILTGCPPYVGNDGMAIYQLAVEGDLGDALMRLDQCGADAELISMTKQCLATKPEERPRDAGQLTNILTAYLHSVEARVKRAEMQAVEATTKVVEERKRRKVTFRLAAAILMTLLAGLAGSLWQMKRAMAAEELATQESQHKEIQRELAVSNEKLAQRRLNQVEQGVDLLTDLLKDLNPRKEKERGQNIYETLVARALQAAEKLSSDTLGDPVATAKMQSAMGLTLRELGKPREATALLRKAYAVQYQELGQEHEQTLLTLNLLANSLTQEHHYLEAIQLNQLIVGIQSKRLGRNHNDTMAVSCCLAGVYLMDSQWQQAVSILEELKQDGIDHLPRDSDLRLTILHNLGAAYFHLGQMNKSIQILKETATIREQKKGKEHIDTLETKHQLALSYGALRRIPEAVKLLEEVQVGFIQKLGSIHPSTLTARYSLASGYAEMNRLQEAIPLFEEIIALQTKHLGKEHADTLQSMNNLATTYHRAKRTPDAIKTIERIRDITPASQLNDHPERLRVLVNLGTLYYENDQRDKGVATLEEVVPMLVTRLGIRDDFVITALCNLGSMYTKNNRPEKALPIFRQALQGLEAREYQHERCEEYCHTILYALELSKCFDELATGRRRYLLHVQKQYGMMHDKTASQLVELGFALLQLRKYAEAEASLREGWKIRAKLQPGTWRTYNVQSILGETLMSQGKHQEAEPMLVDSFTGMQKQIKTMPEPVWPMVQRAADRVIQFYTITKKPDEVKRWQREKDALPKPK